MVKTYTEDGWFPGRGDGPYHKLRVLIDKTKKRGVQHGLDDSMFWDDAN